MATSSPSWAMREPPMRTSSSGAVRTGVLPRSVRMNEMPSRSASAATSFAVCCASLGCRTVEPWMARSEAMSSSAICDGPSSPMDTPACEPLSTIFACEIAPMRTKSYARDRNAANVDMNGVQPRTCMPVAGGHELLLGDEHLEVAVRVRLAEVLGVRGVGDLAVQGDDVAADVRQRGDRLAVGLAGRDLVARARRTAARRRASRTRAACRPRACATSTERSRSPPSSSIAPVASSIGLPCLPGWSSTAFTPRPFIVLATIATGWPVVASASA